MSYINTYHRFQCNKCSSYNWVDCGNINDMTVEDVLGFECWNCGEPAVINDDDDIEDFSEADFDRGQRFEEVPIKKKRNK